MKKALLPLFLSIISLTAFAQEDATIREIHRVIDNRFTRIIRLVKEDRVDVLSKLIVYPIKRSNPLPDITNAKEFTTYYPIIFDEAYKRKLKRYSTSVIMEHNGLYGLIGNSFHGDIWMDDEGKIRSLNIESKQEVILRNQLTKKIQQQAYPSVNSWKRNIIVGKSDKLLVRVDLMANDSIRYVSWSKGKSISEKPDLVLLNGKQESQGTMGGCTWIFKNGDWTYIVDDVEMCADDSPKDCGLFLRLQSKGVDKTLIRLKEIK